MRILISIMVVLLMVSCKPTSTSHTKEISILSSLADANRRLSPIRAKFNSGRILSTSDVGTLMSIVASKPLIKASEREHLYSLLQQMRIPDAAHTMRTYLLGREFGEHAKDRKETIFFAPRILDPMNTWLCKNGGRCNRKPFNEF